MWCHLRDLGKTPVKLVSGLDHESTGKVPITKYRQELVFRRSNEKTTKKLVHCIIQPRFGINISKKFHNLAGIWLPNFQEMIRACTDSF